MTFRLETIIRRVEILINCLRLCNKKTLKGFLQELFQLESKNEATFLLPLNKIFKCFKVQKGQNLSTEVVKKIERQGDKVSKSRRSLIIQKTKEN